MRYCFTGKNKKPGILSEAELSFLIRNRLQEWTPRLLLARPAPGSAIMMFYPCRRREPSPHFMNLENVGGGSGQSIVSATLNIYSGNFKESRDVRASSEF